MKTFSLQLFDASDGKRFEAVNHFIGAGEEGSFGILADHAPMIVLLRQGLARFCASDGRWRYLALSGGVLRFADNCLTISSVRCFVGEQRDQICQQLSDELARSDSQIHSARASLSQIERALVRRLVELSASGGLRS